MKILCFKIDVLKIIQKFKNRKKEDIVDDEQDDGEKKKFTFEVNKIDDYLKKISDILDVLEQFAFCFTITKFDADISIQTKDNASTGKLLGTFWALYGNVTVFLHNNFIIKSYDIDFSPIWDADSTKIEGIAKIILHTRICRVLFNIKYKKISEIRKRELI